MYACAYINIGILISTYVHMHTNGRRNMLFFPIFSNDFSRWRQAEEEESASHFRMPCAADERSARFGTMRAFHIVDMKNPWMSPFFFFWADDGKQRKKKAPRIFGCRAQPTSAPHALAFHIADMKNPWTNFVHGFGADDQTWTGDLILTKDVLYHLSHISIFWRKRRDSNPRGLSPKRFSRPPRYDRFDTLP